MCSAGSAGLFTELPEKTQASTDAAECGNSSRVVATEVKGTKLQVFSP